MNLRDFSLQMKLRQDRMILLWPSGQTDYSTAQARAITSNLLQAAEGMANAIDSYLNSTASWFQREPLSLMRMELLRARYAVSVDAGKAQSASATGVSLPTLRTNALALVREMYAAADGMIFIEDLHDDFWGTWTDFVFTAMDAAISALGWMGKWLPKIPCFPDIWKCLPDWALWGAAGFGVYWFFLRKK